MTRILIVEDDPALCQMLADMLAFQAYDTLTASRVEQAVNLAQHHVPDLILCDWSLPDGTASRILETLRHIPTIIVSGTSAEALMELAREHGAVGYLTKPFGFQEVIGVVHHTLNLVG
ncbi:MAG: response regulator [Anaerolineae bacterium]|nr:response regulator [Anaerolineae bacterium]